MNSSEKIIYMKLWDTPTSVVYDGIHRLSLQNAIDHAHWLTLAINGSKHSANIVYFDAQEIEKSQILSVGIDGIVVHGIETIKSSVHIVLLTADCAPISFSTRDGNCIWLIHWGWQGIAWWILQNLEQIITEKRLAKDDICIQVWPMIWANYEFFVWDVEKNFEKIFANYWLTIENYISTISEQKCFFNLRGLIIDILIHLWFSQGNIDFHPMTTNDWKNRLPSHRLHTIAKKLLQQVQSPQFKEKFSPQLLPQIFTIDNTIWDKNLDREKRKNIAQFLDATPEEITFFTSKEFEFYVQSTRMMTIVSGD